MPETARAADQLERILHIIPAAAREGGTSLEELARELEVPRETVVEDITEVVGRTYYNPAGAGDEIQIELGPEHVQIWTTGEFRRPVRLSIPEAACLEMALRGAVAGRGGEERGDADPGEGRGTDSLELLARLGSALADAGPEEILERIEAVDLGHDPARIRERVTDALHRREACRIRYLKPGESAPEERTIRPYALVHAEGSWYVLGHCEVSGGVRVFRTDRILAVEAAGRTFEVPGDFDAGEYLAGGRVYRAGEEMEVRVRYSPRIARWIAEREAGEEGPDGSWTVTHHVSDPHWIVRHVLQYGPDAEVLEPESVRGMVRGAVGRWV